MLRWALIFLVVALVAAVLGFGGIAGSAAGIAKIIFGIFVILTDHFNCDEYGQGQKVANHQCENWFLGLVVSLN